MDSTRHNKVAIVLFALYWIVFAVLAISPYARNVWWAENLTIMPIVIILAIMYWRGIRFSTLSYVLMSFLIFIHTVGGHYTFARVPFSGITDFFGWERNNYDRFGHFSVGLYAFPIVEWIRAKGYITRTWIAYLFALFAIMALAAGYELFEWLYAILSDPEAGLAVLGSQGDIWDAQKDILADTCGALFAILLYLILRRNKR
jgi:putative membrane protein